VSFVRAAHGILPRHEAALTRRAAGVAVALIVLSAAVRVAATHHVFSLLTSPTSPLADVPMPAPLS
jgi:hypothetical protein